MAAPHVAGAFAILREAFPARSIGELESLLHSSGKSVTCAGAGTPRIDIGAALDGTVTNPEPEPAAEPRPSTIADTTDHPIPGPGTAQSPITVTGLPGNAPGNLQVRVDATHEWRGDLEIHLVDPNGEPYQVKQDSATEGGGTVRQISAIDTGTSPANGTWKLRA
ncbi:proprotein convertase P-domain-containing protein [Streptomyces sp. NPDC052701]|uniref:proprotein convertase P-domain-containing protein n=1 Tax=Streptomyces sp. NPDC052701 TaxID=3155533 RepID=UPI00342CBA2B